MKKLLNTLIVFIFGAILVSCQPRYQYIEDKINITATTNVMADLANEIGGENVSVYALMAAGIDPHQYIARPSDYTALNKADMILVSGLNLEGKMTSIFESYDKQSNKFVLSIGNKILSESSDELKSLLIEDENFGGNYDPHFWFDIDLYKEAAKYVFEALKELDNTNASYYEDRLNNYLLELNTLNEEIILNLSSIENTDRFLITAHDAFQYFGNKYDFKVYSLQGLSTEDEVSPSDIREVVSVVKEHNVKAIFPETSVPVETITSVKEALSRDGYDVVVGGNLYSDSLGDSDDDNTYIKMYLKNVNIILKAFDESKGA